MKEKRLTKIILQSGLLENTTVSLMERWGLLNSVPRNPSIEKYLITETLKDFVEELELLLQPETLEKMEVVLDRLCENCGQLDIYDEHWLWPTKDPNSIQEPGWSCTKPLKGA